MDKAWLWFLLSCKRYLKRWMNILILLCLPLALWMVKETEQKSDTGILVALYVEGENQLGNQTAEGLIRQSGVFQFYLCDSIEELQDDVMKRTAECGYVFVEDLEERLNQKNYKRSIPVYTAPSTVSSELVQEVVFSRLFECYGKELLKNYVRGNSLFSAAGQGDLWGEIDELYEKYYQNGSTFSFQYQTEHLKSNSENHNMVWFPVRGFISVYIFSAALFAAVLLKEDRKKGLFIRVGYKKIHLVHLACMIAPVSLAAVSGMAALMITKSIVFLPISLFREMVILFGYVGLCTVFAYILECLIKNEIVLCSLIPFFLIGSLIFCPVFFQIEIWFPKLQGISRWFLPSYYLMWF